MSSPLLTLFEVADHYQVSPSTIQRLVRAGRLPPPLRVGRGLRFRPTDLEQAEQRMVVPAKGSAK